MDAPADVAERAFVEQPQRLCGGQRIGLHGEIVERLAQIAELQRADGLRPRSGVTGYEAGHRPPERPHRVENRADGADHHGAAEAGQRDRQYAEADRQRRARRPERQDEADAGHE